LASEIVYSLAVLGTNLFAGTYGGVSLSTDNGASWSAVSNGLTNPYINALVTCGTNLFAGTDAGVWKRPLSEMPISMPAAPESPVLCTPGDSTRNIPCTLTLNWAKATGAVTYRLQVSLSSVFSTTVINDSTITDTTKTIGPLQNNVTYYWRVSAKNEGGTSAWSQVRSFTTIVGAPQAPTLASPSDSCINMQLNTLVSWDAVPGATLYHLQVSTAATFAPLSVDDSTLSAASRSTGPLALATNYYWRVRAKNQAGWGPYSVVRRFSTIRTTSVEQAGSAVPTEYALSQNYPNPFNPSTAIQFALPKSSYVTLRVFDALGKEVTTLVSQDLSPGYFTVRWQASVPSGVYFYRLHARVASTGSTSSPQASSAREFVETKKTVLLR